MAISAVSSALLGLVMAVGSAVTAVIYCLLLWRVTMWFHHPEWSAVIVLIVALAALIVPLPYDEFVRLTLFLALAGVVPAWIEGRRWRREWLEHPWTERQ